jgi:hypothetical protein
VSADCPNEIPPPVLDGLNDPKPSHFTQRLAGALGDVGEQAPVLRIATLSLANDLRQFAGGQ